MAPAALGLALAAAVASSTVLAVRLRRARRALEDARRQVARMQGLLQEGASRYGRVASGVATPTVVGDTPDVVRDVLGLVRDLVGARVVTWWRRTGDGALAPAASSDGAPDAEPASVAALASWVDGEGVCVVQDDAPGGAVVVAPVPDVAGAATRGALVARLGPGHADAGGSSRDERKRRLEGAGVAIAGVALLQETQRSASREGDVTRALLAASREFTELRSAEALADRICATALAVSGAGRAALVRWDAAHARGRVVASTRGHAVAVGQAAAIDAVVGEACAEMRPVVWNAAPAPDGPPLFVTGEAFAKWRSGAVLPLARGRAVLGALIVESEAAGALREAVVRTLTLLAAISVPPLEAVWDYEEVERRARTDALTGLWNRRHFEAELARWQEQVDRYGGSLGLLMCDVDHFKRVNDTHGHEAGDAVLRHVAAILGDGARTVDLVARLGGEEFAVLLPATTVEAAAGVAERLRATLERAQAPLPGGGRLAVTASFGAAAYPVPVARSESLVGAADAALYAAKRGGRNRVELSPG